MSREPSRASQRDLAKLLNDLRLSGKQFEGLLPPDLSLPKAGGSIEDLIECVASLAKQRAMTNEILGILEEKFSRRPEDFNRIRVDMEFIDPPQPLLAEDKLEGIKVSARKGGLHEGVRYKRLEARLPAKFKETASTSLQAPEQLDAWFDAANRQPLPPVGRPWMTELLEAAVAVASDGEGKVELNATLDHLTKAGSPPWSDWHQAATTVAPEGPPAPVAGAGESASVDEPPAALRPKAGYALVIGISKYAHARGADSTLGSREFTNLKFAGKDAADFAAFLREHKDIDFRDHVQCLIDEKASLRQIMQGLDTLRQQCRASEAEDPVTIVYFSGHGMPDKDGRHYLVPYDGEPDHLFATALWNRMFNSALDELPTKRLVVFLDACHAGAMPPQSAKKGTLLQYNPSSDLELKPQEGRYFIASCSAGQWSHELTDVEDNGRGNGIFTKHLLELLRCEDIDKEEIDLSDLYRGLRTKVDHTARTLGEEQLPIANVSDCATGIVLAINKKVRDSRIEREETDRSKRARFLDFVINHLKESKFAQKNTIILRLKDFVKSGRQAEDVDPVFYGAFIEAAQRWKGPDDKTCVRETCHDLAGCFSDVNPSVTAPRSVPAEYAGRAYDVGPLA